MSKYDIDFKRLAMLLLPTALRRPRLSALAQVLMAPISRLGGELGDYRKEKDYRLRHNGQTCYLRAVINDRFDPVLRRIEIVEEDVDTLTPVVYPREDHTPLVIRYRNVTDSEGNPLEQTLFFRRGFGGTDRIDFWIRVPQAVRETSTYSELSLRALANQYRLTSKRFGIVYN